MILYVNHTLNKLHKFSFCGSLNGWITKQCIALTVLEYKLKILAVEVLQCRTSQPVSHFASQPVNDLVNESVSQQGSQSASHSASHRVHQ